jgi:hypothetical protein
MRFQSSKRTREVDVLRERTRDGMDAKLRAGVWPQKAPIGYINMERQVRSNKYERWVEPDPEFQKSMKEAWELLLTGRYTLRQICDEFTKRGYTRADGLPWARDDHKTGDSQWAYNRLCKIFHNPFYAGWAVSERFGIKMREVRGQWDPIVTTKQFLQGLEILNTHNNEKSRPRTRTRFCRVPLQTRTGALISTPSTSRHLTETDQFIKASPLPRSGRVSAPAWPCPSLPVAEW